MDRPTLQKTFVLDHVIQHDRTLYNVNNLGDRPSDYFEVLSQSDTKNWVKQFHHTYHTIELGTTDLKWMKEALKIGMHTAKCSELYEEELEDSFLRHKDKMPPGDWFVRTDRVSLKQGMHGKGPYNNFKKILESMVSTTSTHCCFGDNDTTCTIYFLPWLDMQGSKEFRIFVHQNRITAISAQQLYRPNEWLAGLTDEQLNVEIYKVLDYFESVVKDKMSYMASYTMDLVILENGLPYFIEANSFGANYASGSALFHWITDHHILTTTDPTVLQVRYTVSSSDPT